MRRFLNWLTGIEAYIAGLQAWIRTELYGVEDRLIEKYFDGMDERIAQRVVEQLVGQSIRIAGKPRKQVPAEEQASE